MPTATRPLATDPLVALADRCVQCGLCLPVCPTYGREKLEAESPRGRIALVKAWALDTVPATNLGDAHLDHCLGCRSCEAVCPAGVEYDALLVSARGRQRLRRGAGLMQRGLEALVRRPRLLSLVLGCYRRLHPMLPRRLRPLPAPPSAATGNKPTIESGQQSEPMAVFVGCIADPYEAPARAALSQLCAALSIPLETPEGQTCCGNLHAHAGNREGAERLAACNRVAFTGHSQVLTLASGCHGAVASAVEGATLDALAMLDAQRDRLVFQPRPERVALHMPCTQRNVSGTVPALRRLLATIPELTVVEIDAGFGCCGAAGSQMLTDPARANDYRQPLLDQLATSGANRLLSANIGCRLHLANGTSLPVQHPLEFLADALLAGGAPNISAAPVGGP